MIIKIANFDRVFSIRMEIIFEFIDLSMNLMIFAEFHDFSANSHPFRIFWSFFAFFGFFRIFDIFGNLNFIRNFIIPEGLFSFQNFCFFEILGFFRISWFFSSSSLNCSSNTLIFLEIISSWGYQKKSILWENFNNQNPNFMSLNSSKWISWHKTWRFLPWKSFYYGYVTNMRFTSYCSWSRLLWVLF